MPSLLNSIKNMATKKKKTITKSDIKTKESSGSASKAESPSLDLPKTLKDIELFYRERNFSSAKDLAAIAVAAYPKSFDALHLYGLVAFQLGDADSAIDYVRKALAVDSKHALAYFNLANILRSQKKIAEAADAYQKAIANNLEHAQVEYMYGVTLQELNQAEEALKHFAKAVELQPNFLDAKKRKEIISQALAKK
jgi:tetratricopeptide (TPR) repeat protein